MLMQQHCYLCLQLWLFTSCHSIQVSSYHSCKVRFDQRNCSVYVEVSTHNNFSVLSFRCNNALHWLNRRINGMLMYVQQFTVTTHGNLNHVLCSYSHLKWEKKSQNTWNNTFHIELRKKKLISLSFIELKHHVSCFCIVLCHIFHQNA